MEAGTILFFSLFKTETVEARGPQWAREKSRKKMLI